jgi:hypothetical protein
LDGAPADGLVNSSSNGAPDGFVNAERAPDRFVDAADGAVTRKKLWVWTGSCCTMEIAPIIKLLISVHTPQRDGRFCLEDMAGERMVLLV